MRLALLVRDARRRGWLMPEFYVTHTQGDRDKPGYYEPESGHRYGVRFKDGSIRDAWYQHNQRERAIAEIEHILQGGHFQVELVCESKDNPGVWFVVRP